LSAASAGGGSDNIRPAQIPAAASIPDSLVQSGVFYGLKIAFSAFRDSMTIEPVHNPRILLQFSNSGCKKFKSRRVILRIALLNYSIFSR
jgi:hypothetical protein